MPPISLGHEDSKLAQDHTLCIMNDVPIIPVAFVNSGGESYNTGVKNL